MEEFTAVLREMGHGILALSQMARRGNLEKISEDSGG